MITLLLLALSVFLLSANQAQTARREAANSYLERGNQWLKKGEVERAIEAFSFAVSFDPTLDQAYFNRGVARERKGDNEGALSDYNRALQLNARNVDAPIAPYSELLRSAIVYVSLLIGFLDWGGESSLPHEQKLSSQTK